MLFRSVSQSRYHIVIQSGGRPDICIAHDTKGELVPSNHRYIVLSGQYSLGAFVSDSMKMAATKTPRTVAVYAD